MMDDDFRTLTFTVECNLTDKPGSSKKIVTDEDLKNNFTSFKSLKNNSYEFYYQFKDGSKLGTDIFVNKNFDLILQNMNGDKITYYIYLDGSLRIRSIHSSMPQELQ